MELNPYDIEPRTKSIYPEPFATMINGRSKRALGNFIGITKYGINLTTIKPGGVPALMHRHSKSDEFVFIIKGTATVVTENEKFTLSEGECTGFIPSGPAHMLRNESSEDFVYLEICDLEPGDEATYPNDDITAAQDESGKWVFAHKDGRPY